MNKQQPFSLSRKIASLVMLLLLSWLTVCLPYVAKSGELVKKQIQVTEDRATDTDNTNPLDNTNEEKSESGMQGLSEYLPDHYQFSHHFIAISCLYKGHTAPLYTAYHPDCVIPPPEA